MLSVRLSVNSRLLVVKFGEVICRILTAQRVSIPNLHSVQESTVLLYQKLFCGKDFSFSLCLIEVWLNTLPLSIWLKCIFVVIMYFFLKKKKIKAIPEKHYLIRISSKSPRKLGLSFEAGNTVSRALPSLLTQLCCPQVTQASWVAICLLSSTCNSSPSPQWENCSGRKHPSFPWQFYNSELHRLKIFSAFMLSSRIFYRHWGLEESEGEVKTVGSCSHLFQGQTLFFRVISYWELWRCSFHWDCEGLYYMLGDPGFPLLFWGALVSLFCFQGHGES